MITHIPTNKTVVIVDDAGDGKVKVVDSLTLENTIVDLKDLKPSHDIRELRNALIRAETNAKRQAEYVTQRTTKNGITIQGLLKLGHRVQVEHYRSGMIKYSTMMSAKKVVYTHNKPSLEDTNFTDEVSIRAVVLSVPSTSRRLFDFLPKGGHTRIKIQHKDGTVMWLNTTCNPKENFCYKIAVKNGLDKLTEEQIAHLTK